MTREEAKHLSEVLKAYSEGKKIEIKNGDKGWIPIYGNPWFTGNPMIYRVKPEPVYRPYANTEEFLKAQKEHGPYILNGGIYIFPVCIHPAGIGFSTKDDLKNYKRMMEYKWQDGTPCGIMED